jgi:hypothetical protein
MLTKISSNQSINFTTNNIKKIKKFDNIQDNLHGYLLIKNKNKTFILNYYNNKKYLHNRIQIHFNGITISKQIESFDQNNCLIANKLRMYVLSLIENNIDSVLGIGGEYYLYFLFINAKKYIGISNHQCIIEDAEYNIHYSKNYLVDYNNIFSYPEIDNIDTIILNVYNIHTNIIKFIKSIKFNKLIIISCELPDNKLILLKNNFKIIIIKYFRNFDNLIRIILLSKI